MESRDHKMQKLTEEVLAERGLPTNCVAFLHVKDGLVEIKLGSWARSHYRKTRFVLGASTGLDAYDKKRIEDELDSLTHDLNNT